MLSHGNVYKFCCIGILISWLCPNVVLMYGLYVWNSNLTMRSSKVRSRLVRLQYSRYQPSQIFHTTKPNDCKNLTFDAVSFFLDVQIFLIALWQKLCPLSVKRLQCQFLNWSSTICKNCRHNCPQLLIFDLRYVQILHQFGDWRLPKLSK